MFKWLTENEEGRWLSGTEPEFTKDGMNQPLQIVHAVGKVKTFVTDWKIGYFVIAY